MVAVKRPFWRTDISRLERLVDQRREGRVAAVTDKRRYRIGRWVSKRISLWLGERIDGRF